MAQWAWMHGRHFTGQSGKEKGDVHAIALSLVSNLTLSHRSSRYCCFSVPRISILFLPASLRGYYFHVIPDAFFIFHGVQPCGLSILVDWRFSQRFVGVGLPDLIAVSFVPAWLEQASKPCDALNLPPPILGCNLYEG
ncbi:hypothetical protein [Gallaecimonas sp. GXIMD1310]|uniref:hypothetical protein n=1 Tax=Gallaecimonas sp. GXIMD1310 TaxID=3131926 RepID=UPI00324A14A3